jgi:hypothetical protein
MANCGITLESGQRCGRSTDKECDTCSIGVCDTHFEPHFSAHFRLDRMGVPPQQQAQMLKGQR